VAEDYSWAKTQTAGRSCCGDQIPFGFQLDSFVYTHTVEHASIRFLLVLNSICAAGSGTWLLGKPEVSAYTTTYIVTKFPFLTERDFSLQRSQETNSPPGPSAILLTILVSIKRVLDASPPTKFEAIRDCTSPHQSPHVDTFSFTCNPNMDAL